MRIIQLFPLLASPIVALSSQIPITQDPLIPTISDDFQVYQSHISPSHSIRLRHQNATLCNTTVGQYTGWLDVASHHLFFWYFKAENTSPSSSTAATDPLTLWLNGGPGGSSMLGMLGELGPCLINDHGNGTAYNPYGWNKDTALVFVDQPAGVGFSYADDGEPLPGNSFTAAADMHLFMQMFVSQVFPEHRNGDVVLTGESYAGHYIPALGAQIVSQNILYPKRPQVHLKSVAIGNAYVSPMDVAFGYWETLCTTNPGVSEPVFNQTRCDILATNLPRCLAVLKVCYENPDPAICHAASTICETGVMDWYDKESHVGGRNRFDITAPCDIEDLCYKNVADIENYLNLPSTYTALGVPSSFNYSFASEPIANAFELTNDLSIAMVPQVIYLLTNQIDVLIYSGNLDLACSTAAAKRWTANMAWKGQAEFVSKELTSWKSVKEGKTVQAGKFKEVNIKMGEDEKRTRFALVTIDGSGHMVPQDQPEVALDMLSRWLAGKSFD